MDILQLIDRLEELFNESKTIPLTRSVMVDEDKMLDIIDQMRIAIPEEVKKAQQLISQRDRVLAQAQEESVICLPNYPGFSCVDPMLLALWCIIQIVEFSISSVSSG